jgi:hypothetical protein
MAIIDSLVFCFNMEEASGTRTDVHAGLTLSDNNTVTQNPGKLGQAAQFTRVNDEYLSAADAAAYSHGDIDFTYSAWIYPDSFPGAGNTCRIVNKNRIPLDSSDDWEVAWSVTGDTHVLTCHVGNGAGAFTTANSALVMSAATWYHCLFWHDAALNTINLQVNNGTVASNACSHGSFDGNGTMLVGRSENAADRFDGRIDQLCRWNKVLTSTERTQLYNSGAGLAYPFPVAAIARPRSLLTLGAGP